MSRIPRRNIRGLPIPGRSRLSSADSRALRRWEEIKKRSGGSQDIVMAGVSPRVKTRILNGARKMGIANNPIKDAPNVLRFG
ncbi:MAG TPA: hypothetical protein VJH23_05550 [archaeon]|nr:hypothetical protein [archaeon]